MRCVVNGCERDAERGPLGMCPMHRARVQRNGTPGEAEPRTMHGRPVADQFWAKVDKRGPDECWPWTASLASGGYGDFNHRGRTRKAHTLAYELLVGPIPEGRELDHICHDSAVCRLGSACPHRRCCNPAHLEPVTHLANVRREAYAQVECKYGHPLPPPAPNGLRVCVPCRNERQRKYRRQARERREAIGNGVAA